jgi:RNA polymerase sigma-B factor
VTVAATARCVTVSAPAERLAATRDLRTNATGGRRDRLLLCRFARSRDPEMREQLVRRYLPLARYAASRYASSAELFDDLVQVATLGLLKAIDRYDPDRGVAFSSYALPTMDGELRRHFRDRGWAVRPPRGLQEQALRIERAADQLQRELRRSPNVDELAERTGFDAETVLEARAALAARDARSLSAAGGDDDDGDPLQARLGAEDDGYRRAEQRATIATLVRGLSKREREIVRLRFAEDLTQAEIGERVGYSQMHVSRVLRTALERLRLAAETPDEPTSLPQVP